MKNIGSSQDSEVWEQNKWIKNNWWWLEGTEKRENSLATWKTNQKTLQNRMTIIQF